MSFEFSVTRSDRTVIIRVPDPDANIDALVDAFEAFLRAAEYHPGAIRKALGIATDAVTLPSGQAYSPDEDA